MNNFRRCVIFLLAFFSLTLCEAQDNLLVVVLMVKNEASVICETLRPLVEGGISNFLIFDTGSTDDTIAQAETFFIEHNISYNIIQEPFIDFSTSRNRALQHAEKLFPEVCFILMPDAEWQLYNAQELLDFCQQHRNNTDESYLIRIVMNGYLNFYTPRLIRMHTNVHFVGTVHETLNKISTQKVPSTIFFEQFNTTYGYEKSKHRWLQDRELLIQACELNPHDARSTFYLAQTYACLGDWENARVWYERRVNIHGWDEENFIARYRLAQSCAALGDWDKALCHYLAAYSLRPHRAEPLIELAQHYWDIHEIELAFIFIRRAVEIPYPSLDILFVEKWLYDYTRYDLLGRIAWYVGAYDIGEQAVRTALSVRPDEPYLKKNLLFYTKLSHN